MPPTIVLIRHAQALHNIDKDHNIPDPPLSELGLEQCAALRENLKRRFGQYADGGAAVVVSPMRRTLQTALLALDWLVENGVTFEASADWQENSSKPCDTGTAVSSLAPDFPYVDFGHVDPIWPDKTSAIARRYAYARASILARGRLCLETLYRRPETVVFVVSHAGFLRAGVVGLWFFNSDYRIFEFDRDAVDEDGRRIVRQDPSTLAGGMGLSWTKSAVLGSDVPEEDEGDAEDAPDV